MCISLTGYIKLERFLPKNQHTQRKILNFENWTNGEPQKLAKIRVFKVDYFILPSFLVLKLRSVAQNEWKKHPYIFFLLWFKINEFERKKTKKVEKPKSCRQLPQYLIHICFSIFLCEKSK